MQHLPNLAVADVAFRLQTSPEEAVAHPGWLRARAALLAALHSGRAMILLGLPGSGKTLLLQEVARTLRQEGRAVRLAGRGDALDGPDDAQVLLVDEAGRMGPDGLANLCARPSPFVAAALPGFTDRLTRLSRPVEAVTLPPLAPEEVARYVAARLAAAGQPRGLLEPGAVLALARHSGGLLRLVNIIGGAAVFLAKLDGVPRVSSKHVEEAASMRNDPSEENDSSEEAAPPALAPPSSITPAKPVAALPDYSAAVLRRRAALSTMAAASGLLFAMPWLTQRRPGVQPADAQDTGSQTVQVAQAHAGAPSPAAPDDVAPAPAAVPGPPGIQPEQPRPEQSRPEQPRQEAQRVGTQQMGTQRTEVQQMQVQPTARVAAPPAPRAEPARRADPGPSVTMAEDNRATAAPNAPVRFQGPIFNETMGQGGQVTLVIRKQAPTGAITARFNASQGLSGSGVLAGNVSGTGRITASGQLLMGRNAFMCDLSGTLNGGTLTGSANFVNSGGAVYRSRFNLVRT